LILKDTFPFLELIKRNLNSKSKHLLKITAGICYGVLNVQIKCVFKKREEYTSWIICKFSQKYNPVDMFVIINILLVQLSISTKCSRTHIKNIIPNAYQDINVN